MSALVGRALRRDRRARLALPLVRAMAALGTVSGLLGAVLGLLVGGALPS